MYDGISKFKIYTVFLEILGYEAKRPQWFKNQSYGRPRELKDIVQYFIQKLFIEHLLYASNCSSTEDREISFTYGIFRHFLGETGLLTNPPKRRPQTGWRFCNAYSDQRLFSRTPDKLIRDGKQLMRKMDKKQKEIIHKRWNLNGQ